MLFLFGESIQSFGYSVESGTQSNSGNSFPIRSGNPSGCKYIFASVSLWIPLNLALIFLESLGIPSTTLGGSPIFSFSPLSSGLGVSPFWFRWSINFGLWLVPSTSFQFELGEFVSSWSFPFLLVVLGPPVFREVPRPLAFLELRCPLFSLPPPATPKSSIPRVSSPTRLFLLD